MSRPISNGLFEVAGEKAPKERGFACMQLVKFITDEIANGAIVLGNIGTVGTLKPARADVHIENNARDTLGQSKK